MKINVLAYLLLFVLVIIWGTSFFLIKKAVMYYSPLETGLLRVSFAFILLMPFAFSHLKKINKRQAWICFLSGTIGIALPSILYAIAEKGIDSATAGVLNSLTTLFTLIVGLLFFRLKTRWYNIAGVIIGLAGAFGLISVSGNNSFQFNFQYAILVILATFLYAFNTNIIKSWLKDVKPLTITVFSVFFTGIITTVILLGFTDFLSETLHFPEKINGIGYTAILGMLGTGIAMILFNKLIQITSAVFAASVTYLMPVVALLWGYWDGEKIGERQILWIVFIIAGILLVNTKNSKWLKKLRINS